MTMMARSSVCQRLLDSADPFDDDDRAHVSTLGRLQAATGKAPSHFCVTWGPQDAQAQGRQELTVDLFCRDVPSRYSEADQIMSASGQVQIHCHCTGSSAGPDRCNVAYTIIASCASCFAADRPHLAQDPHQRQRLCHPRLGPRHRRRLLRREWAQGLHLPA